jgi:TPR repeat protein
MPLKRRTVERPINALLAGGLLALALLGVARAGPLEDGQTAFDHGDYQTALLLWHPLADRGDAKAQTCLGLMYLNGYGVPQDDAAARKWFRKAADQGDAKAQYLLGVIYEAGEGVPKDTAEGTKWYSKAAEGGFLAAPLHLGVIYYGGKDVPQNYAEAAKWYRKAAEQGDGSAQSMLGAMYAFGQGIPQDYIAAHMWSNLSAAQGNHPKAAALREFLATQMTPAQIVAAQRLAAEWKPISAATSPVGAQKTLPDPPKQLRAGKDCSGIPKEQRTLDCAP